MDLVLGLSMTSADVRWVLVEGPTAEGATVCRNAADLDTLDDIIAAVGDDRLHAVGVTWANEAEDAASTLLDALADRGLYNVITVSEEEAADSLAAGIADRGGYGDVAVCMVEPDDALVTVVDAAGVTTERVAPDADEMLAVLDRAESHPDAIFVLGTADDIDSIAAAFHGAAVPVITAAEADLALARGAALASARAVNTLDARPTRWRMPSRIGALTSVAAAAVVVFVVALSAVLGLAMTPDRDSTVAQRDTGTGQPAQLPIAPSAAQAAPQPVPAAPPPPPPAAPPPAAVTPPAAQTIVEAVAPVPDAIPMIEPPAAPAPAPPAYVPPPPPPAYVPPPPQPRLRDRIIERIPIINRFHEPQYPYGN
ncbi:hypothetical protein Mycsm_00304 [Mycobacterium sp. JS623]|uniref:DUF7159 family protein n=1 Tax=Mycobacterium sp. JS623 TaxID=212767 RepID=UPI0002A55C7D|nr:hypothetical protein [Mycobacterium sp. JS623]AGB20759.1 hypothetical protein Mycsm_00304 [Mycobacterium sp. JS623]